MVNLLLVEDNAAEARLLQELLKGTIFRQSRLVHVNRMGEAIAHLQTDNFDVILLDLTLPDSTGLGSLDSLIQHAPSLPIVVLTNTNDTELAVEAVRHGAQDYLFKRQVNQDSLVRAVRYAIERKQSAEALREANEILEQRVQERTAELETSNRLLLEEIQHRQQTQERLELAQQAGKIGTFEWRLPSNQLMWTAELEALYGFTPGSFNGQYNDWVQTIHPDDRSKVEQELWQGIAIGQGLNTEFRIICPTGETRWMAIKSSLFQNQSGEPQRLIGIHMDITEKKQLEEQFLRAQRLESLGTLASGIAHDLNNILTPILAVAQLLPLKLPNLTDQNLQLVKTLESSARRGAALVKQILSFARGVEGKKVQLQVDHLLLEIEKIIQQTIPKTIAIQTNLDSKLWPVSGDATQLHQVFVNLCINARDAMPDGGTLRITAENQRLDESQARMHLDAEVGPYVVVTIADTGVGIPADILSHIFDPFFTTKEIGKGTGLGLSAVLGIVKSHGGFVDVFSEVSQGSEFRIYLPATETRLDPEQDSEQLIVGAQELILVVDDEPIIRETIKIALEANNYQVLTAADGAEAIAIVAQNKDTISALLMDVMMPSMDGMTAISAIRRFKPNIAAIAMSGLNSTETVSQAYAEGFHSFLAKPFTAQDLFQALQQAISTQKTMQHKV